MNRKILLPALALLFAILACTLRTVPPAPATSTVAPASPQPLTPTVPIMPTPTDTALPLTPTSTSAAATSAPGELTSDMLKNGTYTTPAYNHTFTRVNGAYSGGSGTSAFRVRMLEVYTFGDLNGDKKNDAAIILAENEGGSGNFETLVAVINQNGKPYQQSTADLGDRNLVKGMDISNGVIHLDMVVHAPNDPLCCPSLPQKQNFWLIDNRLWLMRVTSTIGGTEHIINVDSPAIWNTVGNPFTVKGSVSVLPFENTLAYHLYRTDGTMINESPQSVTPSTGTAGTFARVDWNPIIII